MQGRATDHRNRDLWQFHLDVVRGQAGGQVIWQPRIGCWYDDKVFLKQTLPGRLAGKDLPGIYRELGVSNRVYDYNSCYRMVHDPRVRFDHRALNELETEHTIETPVGRLSCIQRRNTSNPGVFPVKWWITCEEDMRVHTWIMEHSTWAWDQEAYDRVKSVWAFAGAPTAFMPRVTVQSLYIDTMGAEEGVYALYDYPATVEKYFAAMNENHDRLIDVINASPIEVINFGDNVHCGLLTEEIFKKYVMPAYIHRNQRLRAAGKFTSSHWDGDTKSLLPYAKDSGFRAIEAVTPKPQGDVTLQEVKAAFGDDVYLLDGLAAILFEETYPVEDLVRQTEECLELFGGRLVLGISDELPSRGNYERIDVVTRIVDDYNAARA